MGHTGETRQKQVGRTGARRGTRLLLGLITALALAFLCAPTAFAAESEFELHKFFGPDGTGATGFGSASSVAVDQSADVLYVLDGKANALFKFDLEGNPVNFGGAGADISGNELSGLAIGVGSLGARQVAVSPVTHTIYLTGEEDAEFHPTALQAFKPNGEPALFTAGPGKGTNQIGGFVNIKGVAVDANGSIYAADAGQGAVGVSIYGSSGGVILPDLGVPGPDLPANIAVDSNGVLYALWFATHLARYTPSEYPVTPETTYTETAKEVDPNVARSVAVDPATNDLYAVEAPFGGSIGKVVVYDEAGVLQTSFAGPGEEGELERPAGIAVESLGQERVFVGNNPEGGLAQVKVFRPTVSAPSIGATFATDVSADSAKLSARISPHGLATTYHFEYGLSDCATSACTSVPIVPGQIDATQRAAVSEAIFDLQSATTYHYRVVAENSLGTTEGTDRTFTTTLSGLGFKLADNRAWEMVSPARKFGGIIRFSGTSLIQASADGNGLAYPSQVGSLEAEPDGSRAFEESTNLALRGPGGWHSKDITPPHTRATVFRANSEYRHFTPDLAEALIQPYDSTPLSPQASERTLYLRANTTPATYTPLVSGKEGFANIPPGTVFGDNFGNSGGQLETIGSNSLLTHVVFRSSAGLTPGAPEKSLYVWSGGRLQLINRLPAAEGGAVAPVAGLGSWLGSMRHAVSEDGSRVFWSTGGDYSNSSNALTGLYARDTLGEETARLDRVKAGGAGTGKVAPAFQGASADGSVVFFTDSQRLVAGAGKEGRDLYRCVVSFTAPTPGCETLTDLSLIPGKSAEVQDMSPAISEDGSHVYFVARALLDAAANGNGEVAAPGEPNLYLWREGEGVRFIATLADGKGEGEADTWNWGHWPAGESGSASRMTSAGSPGGRFFSFTSLRSLTGYDNHEATSGEPVHEIFRYDALADRLECVSCNPSGARPAGKRLSDFSTLVDPQTLLRDQWVAATLPQEVGLGSNVRPALHQRRGVLDNGRVFFNAIDSLVPADSNGQWDVYQYESLGVGDCTASSGSASISRSGGGCVSLLTSGTADEDAVFLDASLSGDDAFILTPARLSVLDEDSEPDVYDARVDGVPATPAPNNECLGEACQPATQAPNDPTPASAGFKGQGNVKASARKRCAKGKRQVRRGGKARCVARKGQKQKRAGKTGRASR